MKTLKLSIIRTIGVLSAVFFVFFLSSCGKPADESVSDEKSITAREITKPVSVPTPLEKFIKEELISSPYIMYMTNKNLAARSEVRAAIIQVNSAPGEKFFYENQKLDDIRSSYVSGNEEKAFMAAQNLLKNQNLSPMTRAELYFMMGTMSKNHNLNSEALDFIGKAVDAMKEIPQTPEISEKVENYKKMLQTFSEVSNHPLLEDTDEEP